MSLAVVQDEEQVRSCGRAMAKALFQPMRWKRIGTLSDESAKLYESRTRRACPSYSLRAVKPLHASLAQVEAVLTGQTALLGTEATPSLLARLLPATYVSGGQLVRYSTLDHATSERESVALQYVRLRPYTARKQTERREAALLESMDNYVLLDYTLSTKLQRSDTSKRKNASMVASVPSLLHLYRPVSAPTFAEQRDDFGPNGLATNDFGITYIIQEMPPSRATKDQQNETEQRVTLEVVLTCSLDLQQVEAGAAKNNDRSKKLVRQQKQRLRHDALCLTRLQPFIDAYRDEKSPRPRISQTRPREPQHDPKNCDPNMLRGSMFTGGRTCSDCHRKFGPFRWKRHCEACEKVVCNQCMSIVAPAPSLSRRKKRMCSHCLYGETANIAAMQALRSEGKRSVSLAGPIEALVSLENSTTNVYQFPSLESLVTKRKSSRTAAPIETGTPSDSSSRVQIDFGLDPSLVSTASGTPDRRHSWSRQSQLLQESPARATFNAGGNCDFVAAAHDNRRATLPNHTALKNLGSAIAKSTRSRRAMTVLLDDTPNKSVTHHALKSISSLSSPSLTHYLYSASEEKVDHEEEGQQMVAKPCASSKVQFIKLETPEPDYELDFSWYNIFPKAPVERTADELDRTRYVNVSGLKMMDPQSLVFLRHDQALEDLASHVLEAGPQWDTCSINIVGSHEVCCLVTAFSKPELDLDCDVVEMEVFPVVVDDVVPREESVSSYVVHHRSPFFVGEMEHDVRFRAHPLHTEQHVVSLISLPIYSSGADTSGSLAQGITYCVATLDLWKRGHVPASSHVSHDWAYNVGALLRKISARLEAVCSKSHALLTPRPRASLSLGSSCDSRDSTRQADSITDLYDIDSESAVDSPLLSQTETMDRLTSLSYAKVRGIGLGNITGPGSSTWKYDSDNESTKSSQSASSSCSQSSCFSSHRYSAADMHSTIESLLHQASKTSQYISETGVFI